MKNIINKNTIVIASTPTKVWEAITKDQELSKYMDNNMKVISDWKIGSDIEYRCYNPDGSILVWNNKEMVWKGKIVQFEINKVLSIDYNGSAYIIKEVFEIKKLNDESVKLTLIKEEAIDETAAQYSRANNEFMLQLIKKYCEK